MTGQARLREGPEGLEAREWRVRGERGKSEEVERRGPLRGSERLQVIVGRSNSNVSFERPADQRNVSTCCRLRRVSRAYIR